MFSFLCLHFIRPEPCNSTTSSLFCHAGFGLDTISYLGFSASCWGESWLLIVQVVRLDISSCSSSLRASFLSCTALSLREFPHLILRLTNLTCFISNEKIWTSWISRDAHVLFGQRKILKNYLLQRGSLFQRHSSEIFIQKNFFALFWNRDFTISVYATVSLYLVDTRRLVLDNRT